MRDMSDDTDETPEATANEHRLALLLGVQPHFQTVQARLHAAASEIPHALAGMFTMQAMQGGWTQDQKHLVDKITETSESVREARLAFEESCKVANKELRKAERAVVAEHARRMSEK